jgi:hypothetical protein
MPFQEFYAVDFLNWNLAPHVNLLGWPHMTASTPTAFDQAEQTPGQFGLTLAITRDLTVLPSVGATNSLYVDLTAAPISLDTRLVLRAEFDVPNADSLPMADENHMPEPWAIDLCVSPAPPAKSVIPDRSGQREKIPQLPQNSLASEYLVHVTCQFNRRFGGVRLNTPSNPKDPFGVLQADQAAILERLEPVPPGASTSPLDYSTSPLDYSPYKQRDQPFFTPVFFLEHSFCGWNALKNGHTPGNGVLKITREAFSADGRADPLLNAHASAPPILGLGVSLGTGTGYGVMRVRLRRFSVWINGNATDELPSVL